MPVFREVTFRDESGRYHKVLASVDFDGFFSRKFKRVRWKPELKVFSVHL